MTCQTFRNVAIGYFKKNKENKENNMEQFRTTTVILLAVLVMLVSMIATAVICVYLSMGRQEPPMAMELQKLIQIQMKAHPEPALPPQTQPQAQRTSAPQRIQPTGQLLQPEGREQAPNLHIYNHLYKGWVRQETKT